MFPAIVKLYNEADGLADPQVKNWFLMHSVWFPISITLSYVYFIYWLGPRLMKNRRAFNINRIVIIYNVVQVIFNAYLFKCTLEFLIENMDSFTCFKIAHGDDANAMRQRSGNWLFMLNKLMDLMDTIFLVLKKKQSHITFLHVYHHVMTFTVCWTMSKYVPGGELIILGVLNSFVHCVMYLYYLFSLIDSFKKITTFVKKHITQMQILQFILAGSHALYSATDPSCEYPRGVLYFGISQAVILTTLFVNFYRKAYLESRKVDQKLQNGHLKNETVKKTN